MSESVESDIERHSEFERQISSQNGLNSKIKWHGSGLPLKINFGKGFLQHP